MVDIRGDVDQQLLLTFSFLRLNTTLFRFHNPLFLGFFIELAFGDVGLGISDEADT